jgi:hypothetical protein
MIMANDVTIESEELDKFLENVTGNLDKAAEKVIEELSDLSLSEIQNNYSKSEFEPGEAMDFVKVGSSNDKTVKMMGPQAIYSEFGTGTRGAMHPHPIKGQFTLNDYNTGPTIRVLTPKAKKAAGEKAKGIAVGSLYWTYKDAEGNVQYTTGIPAQMQVYKAGKRAIAHIPTAIRNNLKGMF